MTLGEPADHTPLLVPHDQILPAAADRYRVDEPNPVLGVAKCLTTRREPGRRNRLTVEPHALGALLGRAPDPGQLTRRTKHRTRRELRRRHARHVAPVR